VSYTTKIFDMWNLRVAMAVRVVEFNLIELIGSAFTIRKLPPADFVILCFSLIDMDSFNGVVNTWIQYLHGHAPKIPIILVGKEA
ncbi:hypothetical protein HAX54_053224, partial [Datura stramonium]|nr:hypothetical protein [Datura stramonium]